MKKGVREIRVKSILAVLYGTMDSEEWCDEIMSWSLTAEDNGCLRLVIRMYDGCRIPYHKLACLGGMFDEDVEIKLAVFDKTLHIIFDFDEEPKEKAND